MCAHLCSLCLFLCVCLFVFLLLPRRLAHFCFASALFVFDSSLRHRFGWSCFVLGLIVLFLAVFCSFVSGAYSGLRLAGNSSALCTEELAKDDFRSVAPKKGQTGSFPRFAPKERPQICSALRAETKGSKIFFCASRRRNAPKGISALPADRAAGKQKNTEFWLSGFEGKARNKILFSYPYPCPPPIEYLTPPLRLLVLPLVLLLPLLLKFEQKWV